MLTLTYVLFAAAGCLYVLIAAFFGHGSDFGHAVHGAHHAQGFQQEHGGVFHFPFFSPLAIATLIAAIGGFGLIGKYGLGLGDRASLLAALPLAVLCAYGISFFAFKLTSGSRASSVLRLDQIHGSPAEVTAPIPAGGVGEALAMVGSQRYAAPAREINGGALPRGATVKVVGMAGSTLLVRATADPVAAAAPPSSTQGDPHA